MACAFITDQNIKLTRRSFPSYWLKRIYCSWKRTCENTIYHYSFFFYLREAETERNRGRERETERFLTCRTSAVNNDKQKLKTRNRKHLRISEWNWFMVSKPDSFCILKPLVSSSMSDQHMCRQCLPWTGNWAQNLQKSFFLSLRNSDFICWRDLSVTVSFL